MGNCDLRLVIGKQAGDLSVVSGPLSVVSAHPFSNPLILNTDTGPGTARVPACPLRKIALAWIKNAWCALL